MAEPDGSVARRWSIAEGLPQSTVTAILQDADGFLLLGTFGGLSRFDGHRFEDLAADPRLHANIARVTALARSGGHLWVGIEGGGVWEREGDQVWPLDPQPEGLRRAVVHAIVVAPDQTLYVASGDGAYHRDRDGHWVSLVAGDIADLDLAPDGTIWFTHGQQVGWMAGPGGAITYALAPDVGVQGSLFGDLDAQGRYWVNGKRSLMVARRDAPPHAVQLPDGLAFTFAAPLVDPQRRLWLGVDHALLRMDDLDALEAALIAGEAPAFERLPIDGNARTIYVDDADGLWIGTTGAGLLRMSPRLSSRVYAKAEDTQFGYGPLAVDADQTLHAAACYTLITRRPRGQEERRSVGDHGLQYGCATTLHALPQDGLLVGGRPGLVRLGPAGEREDLSRAVGLRDDEDVTAIAEGDDRLLLGTSAGRVLGGVLGGAFTPLELPAGRGAILAILPDGPRLWVGGSGGLLRLEDGVAHSFADDLDFAPSAVRALALDPDGRLWAATYGGGLGWVEEDKAGFIGKGPDDLPDANLSGLYFDGQGRAWIHANRGLITLPVANLMKRARGSDAALDSALLPVGEANGWVQPSMVPLANGNLLLANVDQVLQVDTGVTTLPGRLGAVIFRELSVGGQSMIGSTIQVPPDSGRDLRVRFAVPGLHTQSSLVYQWRLYPAGAQKPAWSEEHEEGLVQIPNLSPGLLTFEVRALAEDVGATEPVKATINVLPMLHERSGVRVAFVLGIAALGLSAGLVGANRLRRDNTRLKGEIDRRTEAERRLAQREAYYRTLFEGSGSGLLLFDPDGCCVAANMVAVELFDPMRQGLEGRRAAALGLGEAVLPASRRATVLIEGQRLDGSAFPAQVVVTWVEVEGAGRVICALTDLTRLVESEQERSRLRDALHTARRLEAVGRLAGGVAHDINNMMTAILGNVDLAIEIDPDRPTREFLDEIRLAIQRGSALVRELLSFGKRPQIDEEALDPNQIIRQMSGMLRRLMPDDIALELRLVEAGTLRIARTALEQIILNLVVNAADALPTGGRVVVRTGPTDEGRLLLEVRDNGVGMSPEVAARIFEPFFSTKGAERGTGLGLATVRDLATQARATLEVVTAPGQGSTFRLTFPAGEPTMEVAPVPSPEPVPLADVLPVAPILVVDDNAGVRHAMVQPLVRAGYRVVEFGDPLEAVGWFTTTDEPPVAVISDVIMPGMNGKQMVETMRAHRPQTLALFVTGYSDDVVFQRGLSRSADLLLEKPFTARQLLEALDRLLRA